MDSMNMEQDHDFMEELKANEQHKNIPNDSSIKINTGFSSASDTSCSTNNFIKQEICDDDAEFSQNTSNGEFNKIYITETRNSSDGEYKDSPDFLTVKQEVLDIKDETPKSVGFLSSNPFLSRTLEEKLQIKRLGRPIPLLNLTQAVKTKTREFTRKFNPEWYQKHDWLCGCPIRNSLFCFPCLLYGGEDAWTKTGMTDLHHLLDRMKKHAASSTHMTNVLDLALLGAEDPNLDSGCVKGLELYNKKVARNRYVLNIIINCIRFCGAFELALRGHDESDSSANPGVFKGLVNFSAELDGVLKTHLDKATVFKGTSKTIQNEMLQCMLEVCHEEIREEVRNCDFLAVVVEETTDIVNVIQAAIIYRYLTNSGKPVERFWKFLTPPSHDAQALASSIVGEISQAGGTPQKVIAQTYNGTSVMGAVPAVVKQTYPYAAYVHNHVHHLNVTILRAASAIRPIRVFFANLQGICTFFFNSPQRIGILETVIMRRGKKFPSRRNFRSKTVSMVFEYRQELVECMQAILDGDTVYNVTTLVQASGMMEVLNTEVFKFWLRFFYKITHRVEIFYGQVQKKEADPVLVRKHTESFLQDVRRIRDSEINYNVTENRAKKIKNESTEWNQQAKEVCDIILSQVGERFSFTGHLAAGSLFQPEKFADYRKSFPEALFKATCEAYPFLDPESLNSELLLLYHQEFGELSGILNLFDFVNGTALRDNFSECLKLMKIVLTVPVTAPETEKRLPTCKRVKVFLRNTMMQENERLSALAMLSIERNFIMEIQDFNQKVIERFATRKERRVAFLYK